MHVLFRFTQGDAVAVDARRLPARLQHVPARRVRVLPARRVRRLHRHVRRQREYHPHIQGSTAGPHLRPIHTKRQRSAPATFTGKNRAGFDFCWRQCLCESSVASVVLQR